jgi:hypothetical protein
MNKLYILTDRFGPWDGVAVTVATSKESAITITESITGVYGWDVANELGVANFPEGVLWWFNQKDMEEREGGQVCLSV